MEFHKPSNLQEATALLAQYGEGAALVNGGTDIVIELAHKRLTPQAVIYIAHVPELQGISEEDGELVLGGAVTYLAMQQSPLCQRITGLMQALSTLGSPAIRAVATPAGNIGTAAPAADCATMLMSLCATLDLASAEGERTVPLAEAFVGRGRTVRKPHELIRRIRFAAPREGFGTGYARVARRKAQDIGKVLVGVSLHVKDGVCTQAGVGLGALNATVVRAPSLETALVGLDRKASMAHAESCFPAEAGLRDSYFRQYKEQVTTSVVAEALDRAWTAALAE